MAAAAPATELGTLLADDMDSAGGKNITAMTLWSWSRVYGAPISNVVTPQAMTAVDRLANECIERFFDAIERRGPSRELNQSYLKVNNFTDLEPWSGLLASDTAGTLPPSIPVSRPGHEGHFGTSRSDGELHARSLQSRNRSAVASRTGIRPSFRGAR